VKRPGDVGQRAVVGLFVAQEMALQLHIHMVAPEQPDERIDEAADAVLLEPSSSRPASATSPRVCPSSSSSASAPSPFGARIFMRVTSLQRFR
jgi:hypothetical protein